MWLFYLLFSNFGWAVILFTLVVKIASFPLNLKQQRNMAVSQLFTPRVQEIQKKYKGNQQKYQEEMSKLQKEGYNPMGGCGPMILTFILLFGVIDVVYKPMTHIEHFDWVEPGSIEYVKQLGQETEYTSVIMGSEEDKELLLQIIEDETVIFYDDENSQIEHPSEWILTRQTGITDEERVTFGEFVTLKFGDLTSNNSRLSTQVKNELKTIQSKYKSLQGELHAVQAYSLSPEAFNSSRINSEVYEKLGKLQNSMIFLGIDLGRVPTLAWDLILIIPIISFLFSTIQMIVTQIIQKKTMPSMANQGGVGMKAMLYITPLFSLFIVFTVPAGAGFYWAVSYLFGIAQSLITYKFWPPEKMREQARQKMKEKSTMFNTTATVVDVDSEGNETIRKERLSDMSGKDQKEYYRKKLEEARRIDRDKYGDVSIDIDVDDIVAQRQKNISNKDGENAIKENDSDNEKNEDSDEYDDVSKNEVE